MSNTAVRGNLLCEHISPEDGRVVGMIVHVMRDHSPDGPADNAFIYVDTTHDQKTPCARYISWINLFDIENAAKREPCCWKLIEPATSFSRSITWMPYGWGDRRLPSIADVIL